MHLEYLEVLHALGVLRVKTYGCIPDASADRGLAVRLPHPNVTEIAVEARRVLDLTHERCVVVDVVRLEHLRHACPYWPRTLLSMQSGSN